MCAVHVVNVFGHWHLFLPMKLAIAIHVWLVWCFVHISVCFWSISSKWSLQKKGKLCL